MHHEVSMRVRSIIMYKIMYALLWSLADCLQLRHILTTTFAENMTPLQRKSTSLWWLQYFTHFIFIKKLQLGYSIILWWIVQLYFNLTTNSHTVSLWSVDSTWPVVVGGVSAPCSHTLVGRRRRTQSSDHLHHIRQHHVTRADCSAAFQDRTVGLLLYVQVWFDGHRPPTTHRVYGDLLVVRTEREEDKWGLLDIKQRIRYHHIYMKSTCEHLLLDVDKNPEHVLVDLEPLEQSGFTVNDRNKLLVTFHAENIWY